MLWHAYAPLLYHQTVPRTLLEGFKTQIDQSVVAKTDFWLYKVHDNKLKYHCVRENPPFSRLEEVYNPGFRYHEILSKEMPRAVWKRRNTIILQSTRKRKWFALLVGGYSPERKYDFFSVLQLVSVIFCECLDRERTRRRTNLALQSGKGRV